MTRISVTDLLGEEEVEVETASDFKWLQRRVGSRRDGTTRTATTPLLAHPPRNKLRVEFLVRRSYTGYVLHEKEGREWRSGASKFPKMVRWPVKLSWKIFQRDMAKNCRCDAYYHDAEGAVHEIFTEDDFRRFLQKAAKKQLEGSWMLLNIFPMKQAGEQQPSGPQGVRSRSGSSSNGGGGGIRHRHKGGISNKQPSAAVDNSSSEQLMASATNALEALVASWQLQPAANSGQQQQEQRKGPEQVARALQFPDKEEKGATIKENSWFPKNLLELWEDQEKKRGIFVPNYRPPGSPTPSSSSSSSASSGCSGLAGSKSPVSSGIMRQQASVFDWMAEQKKNKEGAPPAWFTAYMEAYKDDLVSEITAKVVNSLGVVMEGRLAQQQQPRRDSKTQTVAKVAQRKLDHKKAKKEAIRISMENSGLEQEAAGSTSPRRSVKQDKMVKVVMKMEKKEHRRGPHPTTTSPAMEELGIKAEKMMAKAEKKVAKAEKRYTKAEYKMARAEKKMVKVIEKIGKEVPAAKEETNGAVAELTKDKPTTAAANETKNASVIIDIGSPPLSAERSSRFCTVSPAVTYPLLAVPSYPLAVVLPPAPAALRSPPPPPPMSTLLLRGGSAPSSAIALPAAVGGSCSMAAAGKGYAVFLPAGANQEITEARPGAYFETSVKVVNMGLAWSSDELTLQRMFSSAGLVAPASLKLLPRLCSGEEADIRFGFLVPAAKSSAGAPAAALESVWRFYAGNEPFGPMLRFRFLPLQTEKEEQEEVMTKEERKDQHQDEEEKKDKLAVLDELISSKEAKIITVEGPSSEPENAADDDEEVNHENKLYDKVDATVLPVEDKEVNPVQELARTKDDEEVVLEEKSEEDETKVEEKKEKRKEEEEEEGFEHVVVPDCFRLNIPFVMVPEEKTSSIESAILEASLDEDFETTGEKEKKE